MDGTMKKPKHVSAMVKGKGFKYLKRMKVNKRMLERGHNDGIGDPGFDAMAAQGASAAQAASKGTLIPVPKKQPWDNTPAQSPPGQGGGGGGGPEIQPAAEAGENVAVP
jgi:hypothetical protein